MSVIAAITDCNCNTKGDVQDTSVMELTSKYDGKIIMDAQTLSVVKSQLEAGGKTNITDEVRIDGRNICGHMWQ